MLPKLGCELEEVAEVQQFSCQVCAKIYDRTPAQGRRCIARMWGRLPRIARQPRDAGREQSPAAQHARRAAGHLRSGRHGAYIRGYLGVQTGLVEYK